MTDNPRTPLSWTDALVLFAAILGLLIGVSLVSFEFAVVAGLVVLGYVIFKLITT